VLLPLLHALQQLQLLAIFILGLTILGLALALALLEAHQFCIMEYQVLHYQKSHAPLEVFAL
jgi:hypothetical protein